MLRSSVSLNEALRPATASHRPGRRTIRPSAGPVPFGSAPPPQPRTEQPAQVRSFDLPSVQFNLPSAPSLTSSGVSTELLDSKATQPHWGSATAQQLLGAVRGQVQEQVPGVGAAADALQQLQAGLQQTAAQLSSLPEAAAGGPQAEALQRQLQQQLGALSAAAQSAAAQLASGSGPAALRAAPQLPDLASGEWAGYSLQQLGVVASGMAALVALSVPRGGSDDDQPGGSGGGGGGGRSSSDGSIASGGPSVLPTRWDPEAVGAYYQRRPVLVARRIAEVAAEAAGWGAAYLSDTVTGAEQRNAAARADGAMAAIERLGPAYVKVAQALSTRVDLLAPEYLVAIQRLQDRVPPFPDAVAFAQIERSFGGRPIGAVFSAMSERAVAAASLGQVYRGTLRESGQEVAIKVRRPGVLESVSLDLFLMRQVAVALRSVPEVKSDWAGIIDAWAARFLEEMDYGLEAQNTAQFKQDLAPLAGVLIPDVVAQGSSSDCLVTSWVEGERLTDSSAADVRELCDTLLSAYLIQLLDTGFMHADPHPGNLLRTSDGRIAILDHGLVTQIPQDYMIALLEYIAHLSVGDWDALADDLVALGFVDSMEDKSKIVQPLGRILSQLTAGGGAKKVNINLVMSEIESMTQVYDFKVPPYFALILRTFSVIEGIALQSDPDYSIVRECFPYLSRRLLTDDNPRVRAALRQLLFAGGDHVSLERLERLVQGVNSFTVEGLQGQAPALAAGAPARAPAPMIDSTAREVLGAVFSTRRTYVQELLVGEAVATVDAAARQVAATLLGPALGNIAAAQAAVASRGQLGAAGAQMPPALAMLNKLPALVEMSPDDQQQLRTAQGIFNLVQQQAAVRPAGAPLLDAAQARELARELGPLLPQLLPGIVATGQLFASELAGRAYERLTAVVGGGPAPPRGGDDYVPLDP